LVIAPLHEEETMTAIRSMPRAGPILITGLLVCASGCGGTSPPQPADADQARDALRATLDTWQKGETPPALQQRKPAIRAVDYEWTAGHRLLRYEMGNAEPIGGSLRYHVWLTIQEQHGRSVRKQAVYSIDTSPVLTVHREDDF
jgi:hypothetical protein